MMKNGWKSVKAGRMIFNLSLMQHSRKTRKKDNKSMLFLILYLHQRISNYWMNLTCFTAISSKRLAKFAPGWGFPVKNDPLGFFNFFSIEFTACLKPPSKDNQRKASYPKMHQRDQWAGWTQIMWSCRIGEEQRPYPIPYYFSGL